MAYLCGHSNQALSNFELGTTLRRTLDDGRPTVRAMGSLFNLKFLAMVLKGSGNVDRAVDVAEEAAEIARRVVDS
jgi:hypothetical protein